MATGKLLRFFALVSLLHPTLAFSYLGEQLDFLDFMRLTGTAVYITSEAQGLLAGTFDGEFESIDGPCKRTFYTTFKRKTTSTMSVCKTLCAASKVTFAAVCTYSVLPRSSRTLLISGLLLSAVFFLHSTLCSSLTVFATYSKAVLLLELRNHQLTPP
jgi:hypothetical protein